MSDRLSPEEIARLEELVAHGIGLNECDLAAAVPRLLAELRALRQERDHAWKVCDERCRERDKAERERDELAKRFAEEHQEAELLAAERDQARAHVRQMETFMVSFKDLGSSPYTEKDGKPL